MNIYSKIRMKALECATIFYEYGTYGVKEDIIRAATKFEEYIMGEEPYNNEETEIRMSAIKHSCYFTKTFYITSEEDAIEMAKHFEEYILWGNIDD